MIYKNSFYLINYGCSFNKADSQKVKYFLLENGFFPATLTHSEYIIINSCAVKAQTHEKIINFLKNLNLHHKQKLIVMGCLPWISSKTLSEILNTNPNIIGIIDSNQLLRLPPLMRENNSRYIKIIPKKVNINKAKLKPWRDCIFDSAIIQISEGCNRHCSYCCTRNSRGTLLSYNKVHILDNIRYFLKNEVKEIFLTSQDCGNYLYFNVNLISLLKAINSLISSSNHQEIFIRLGMLNPEYIVNNVQELLNVLNKDHYYQFLHIPIQSASDKVLKLMNRNYRRKDIEKIFNFLRSKSNFTIATDIICGFPHESDKDFLETKDFILKYKPDIVNISKYTLRPNTVAAKMQQNNSEIIKKRSDELTNIYNKYRNKLNEKWLGWIGNVYINKYKPRKDFPYSGRNQYYIKIALKNAKINKFYKIKIIGLKDNNLIAQIL